MIRTRPIWSRLGIMIDGRGVPPQQPGDVFVPYTAATGDSLNLNYDRGFSIPETFERTAFAVPGAIAQAVAPVFQPNAANQTKDGVPAPVYAQILSLTQQLGQQIGRPLTADESQFVYMGIAEAIGKKGMDFQTAASVVIPLLQQQGRLPAGNLSAASSAGVGVGSGSGLLLLGGAALLLYLIGRQSR